ncbi:MAG: 30S ribosomal protein S2 [Parcubacteria group bacterium RIFCSPLOWO2_01_FULL_48_18]|nr:MAG: 30S ribosomal protein S2 [Parcubacteria group bacterium RIFCSPLOWO2_01_FULL_48_18]
MQAMAEAGILYGRKKTKTHPKMRPYIFTTRNTIEIIDLAKTKEKLEQAKDFVQAAASKNGMLLFVGTQPAARSIIQETASRYAYPYVNNRWLGGTLTNFKVISKRIEYLKKLRLDLVSGALDKYTKRERVQFNKELGRLEQLLSGLENLSALPEALFVVNVEEHTTAVREAKRLHIPVVAIVGTASDPNTIDYPIPANDAARSSIVYLVVELEEAIKKGIKERKEKPLENKKEAGGQ